MLETRTNRHGFVLQRQQEVVRFLLHKQTESISIHLHCASETSTQRGVACRLALLVWQSSATNGTLYLWLSSFAALLNGSYACLQCSHLLEPGAA